MPGMAASTQAFIPTFSPCRETLLVVLATMKAHQKKKGFVGDEMGRNEREEPETASLSPKGQREIGVVN